MAEGRPDVENGLSVAGKRCPSSMGRCDRDVFIDFYRLIDRKSLCCELNDGVRA